MIELTRISDGFEALRWVAQARGDDETRAGICQRISIQEDSKRGRVAIATNGKRLHLSEISDDIPAGEYEVKRATVASLMLQEIDEPATFPNWKAVIPDGDLKHGKVKVSALADVTPVAKVAEGEFQTQFLVDAVGYLPWVKNRAAKEIEVWQEIDTKNRIPAPLKITYGERVAVVMPVARVI